MDILKYKANPFWTTTVINDETFKDLFPKIGRLLYVCQRFETNCKRIAADIHISETEGLFSSEESYSKFLNKIRISTLNSNIKQIEKLGIIGDPFESLSEARKSRNFVVHEILIELENKTNTLADHSSFQSELLHRVKVIANGEFVSSWLCGIILKDPLPNLNRIDETIRWVLNKSDETNAV